MWSREQEDALLRVKRWLKKRDDQVFRLFGYAGTGKTTLALELGNLVKSVQYAAFTGKAAHVMRRKGCTDASTIHRLIYDSDCDADTGRYHHELKDKSEFSDVDLIVIDECSMVDAYLGKDLLSFGILVLTIGDPAQLSPIKGDGFFMQKKPDVLLTEIYRQARDNPILRLADAIRRGKPLPRPGYREGDNLQVCDGDFDPDQYDVELVGLNDTRQSRIQRLRHHLGFADRKYRPQPDPQTGEILVCLRNDYSVSNPVYNGSLWNIERVQRVGDRKLPVLKLDLTSEDGGETTVQVPLQCFTKQAVHIPGLQMFDYGYALTVHKAQGSEWDRVLLFNESHIFKQEATRWLYTGITRASERLTIVDYR